jgi:hypothetical protein
MTGAVAKGSVEMRVNLRFVGMIVILIAIPSAVALLLIVLTPLLDFPSRILLITAVILVDTIAVMILDYIESGRKLEAIRETMAETGRKLDGIQETMAKVANDMKILADDINRRAQLRPRITASFGTSGKTSKSIQLPRERRSAVDLFFYNGGPVAASDVRWMVLFPPDFTIDDPQQLTAISTQPSGAYYPGAKTVEYPRQEPIRMAGPKTSGYPVVIFVTPGALSPRNNQIPVNGYCAGQEQSTEILEIIVS